MKIHALYLFCESQPSGGRDLISTTYQGPAESPPESFIEPVAFLTAAKFWGAALSEAASGGIPDEMLTLRKPAAWLGCRPSRRHR